MNSGVMEIISLDLGEQSYEITIGSGLLSDPELVTAKIEGKQVFIVSNQTVADLYLDKLYACLKSYHIDLFLMPDVLETTLYFHLNLNF